MKFDTQRDRDRIIYSEFRPKRLHFSTGQVQTVKEPPTALKASAIRWLMDLEEPDKFLASLQVQVRQWRVERKFAEPLSAKQMLVLIGNYLA